MAMGKLWLGLGTWNLRRVSIRATGSSDAAFYLRPRPRSAASSVPSPALPAIASRSRHRYEPAAAARCSLATSDHQTSLNHALPPAPGEAMASSLVALPMVGQSSQRTVSRAILAGTSRKSEFGIRNSDLKTEFWVQNRNSEFGILHSDLKSEFGDLKSEFCILT